MDGLALGVSVLALGVSGLALWLTSFYRGKVTMTRPAVIAFLKPSGDGPKVFLRSLFHADSDRGQVVEYVYVRLRRGESSQNFPVWVYGERNELVRGSGLYVGKQGVAANHHFLLAKDGRAEEASYDFVPGDYYVEVFVALVGKSAQMVQTCAVGLSTDHAAAIRDGTSTVYFDWGPETGKYIAHVRRELTPLQEIAKQAMIERGIIK